MPTADQETKPWPTTTLCDVEKAIRASWSLETCDPVDAADWHDGNPARGQCGVTTPVLQDLLGGELLVAEVEFAGGGRQGVHWWNRMAGGVEVDLTRGQSTDGELIGDPRTVPRPAGPPRRRREQYLLLRTGVLSSLGMPVPHPNGAGR